MGRKDIETSANKINIYVTDTHCLAWYLGDSSKLSQKARAIFEKASESKVKIIIPIIVIAELIFLIEKKKLKAESIALIDTLLGRSGFEIVPLYIEQIRCLAKEVSISKMHDRLITCDSLIYNAELITKDKEIRDTKLVKTIW